MRQVCVDSGSPCQLHLQHVLGHLLGLVVCQILALGDSKRYYVLPQICVSNNFDNEYNHEVEALCRDGTRLGAMAHVIVVV